MSRGEFIRCTWREYALRRIGFNRLRSYQFENTRAIIYTLAAINRDPKKALEPMESFWPLPTDDNNVKQERKSDAQVREQIIATINKLYGKNIKA